jgi:hypothetical protein
LYQLCSKKDTTKEAKGINKIKQKRNEIAVKTFAVVAIGYVGQ